MLSMISKYCITYMSVSIEKQNRLVFVYIFQTCSHYSFNYYNNIYKLFGAEGVE